MRLYDASSNTPLALPPSTALKYRAPKNFLPEKPTHHIDHRKVSRVLAARHRLPCQSPLPRPIRANQYSYRPSGPTLSEIASTSTTSAALGYWPVHYSTDSFRFDIDDTPTPNRTAAWSSDDETFSRSTSSTISSFASVNPTRRTNWYGIKPIGIRQGAYTDREVESAEDDSSFAAGDAWWEASGLSTASSPRWQVRRPTTLVKDLRSRPPTPRKVKPVGSVRKATDRMVSLFPTSATSKNRESPGRFVVSTYDGWETFSSQFGQDGQYLPSTKLPSNDFVPEKPLPWKKNSGIDIRKQHHQIKASDTATTCDTSDSSKEDLPKVAADRTRPKAMSGKPMSPPCRRVPILLGHILEEKYQQTRRLRDAKTTIDEVGFPLSAGISQDSMMLITKNEDNSCSLATTFVRATTGQWTEIVTL
jgi:hypothetical protein